MASIFTGLAFMHGHIVDKELVRALGALDNEGGRPRGTPRGSELANDALPQAHRSQAHSHREQASGDCGAAACC
jgi:hypothetical protein